MTPLIAIYTCFSGLSRDFPISKLSADMQFAQAKHQLAVDIINILVTATQAGSDLQARLEDALHPYGWYGSLAKRVLDRLVECPKGGPEMGAAMQRAFYRASYAANNTVGKQSFFEANAAMVVAIGILAQLAPAAVEALGFGEFENVEGSLAAWWQSTLSEEESESFLSYLQELGMDWSKK